MGKASGRPPAGVSASPPPPPPTPRPLLPALPAPPPHTPPPLPALQRRLGSRPSSAEQTCEASAGPSPAPCWSLACPLINQNPKAQFAPTPPGCQDRKWRQDGGEQTAPLPCPNPARPAPTRRDSRAGRPCLSARPEPRGPVPTRGTRAGADQETRLEVRWLCRPPQRLTPASDAVVVFNGRVRALKTCWLRLVLVGT